MRRVVIESPYAGDVGLNLLYLRACLADSLSRGEAPYASHAIYTQPGVLRDDVPEERERGIECWYAWYGASDGAVFYVDLGWSRGMLAAREYLVKNAETLVGLQIEERMLGQAWETLRRENPQPEFMQGHLLYVVKQARDALAGVQDAPLVNRLLATERALQPFAMGPVREWASAELERAYVDVLRKTPDGKDY